MKTCKRCDLYDGCTVAMNSRECKAALLAFRTNEVLENNLAAANPKTDNLILFQRGA